VIETFAAELLFLENTLFGSQPKPTTLKTSEQLSDGSVKRDLIQCQKRPTMKTSGQLSDGSRPASVAGADVVVGESVGEAVVVAVTLNMDLNKVGDVEAFKRDVASDVSRALELDARSVNVDQVLRLREGSIIVDLGITPQSNGPDLHQVLVEQAKDSRSALMLGKYTSKTLAISPPRTRSDGSRPSQKRTEVSTSFAKERENKGTGGGGGGGEALINSFIYSQGEKNGPAPSHARARAHTRRQTPQGWAPYECTCGIGFGTSEALHVHLQSQNRPTVSVDRGKRDLLQSQKRPTVSGEVSASPSERGSRCSKGFGTSDSESLHVHMKLKQQPTTANAEEDALAGGVGGGGEWEGGGGVGGGRLLVDALVEAYASPSANLTLL
jgi:hypothetical protein